MRIAESVTFGGARAGAWVPRLDRAGHLRGRPEGARPGDDPAARVLPLWRGRPLVRGGRLAWVVPGHAGLDPAAAAPALFLGRAEGAARWAVDLIGWEPDAPAAPGAPQPHPALPGAFADLRAAAPGLDPLEAELAATARALAAWHATHGFCARCGARSEVTQLGWQRTCPACGGHHFPRTDPVVIMLITHGEAVLLGRAAAWPAGMYSLLAGFMEPGETVEAAVRREVWEEAGVRVAEVGYLASQPWPFPASLMIGCRGRALGRDLTLDPAEVEDAAWLMREEVAAAFAGRHPRVTPPRSGAIAGFLLRAWLADRLG